LAQFFQRRGCGFQMQTWGVSSSPSDSTERVLNRYAAVFSVDRRCRSYIGRFATTLDLGLFQQNRPKADSCTAIKKSRIVPPFIEPITVLRLSSPRKFRDYGAAVRSRAWSTALRTPEPSWHWATAGVPGSGLVSSYADNNIDGNGGQNTEPPGPLTYHLRCSATAEPDKCLCGIRLTGPGGNGGHVDGKTHCFV